jgi:lipoprotein-releasing system ATP-binding protein
MNKVLMCDGLTKVFAEGKLYVDVLRDINFTALPGEMIAIIGPSGSGKSTLLHLLSGLDKPSSGVVEICGVKINYLSERAKGELRNKYLGFVYQFHHLLPEFSALENVCMPLLIRGTSIATAQRRATHILTKVGLEARLEHRPGELSGGERQRVAIARALVTEPRCVLMDEPTGNLDHKTAEKIYELISGLNKEFNVTFVVVTHDVSVTKRMQRVLSLQDGVLQPV